MKKKKLLKNAPKNNMFSFFIYLFCFLYVVDGTPSSERQDMATFMQSFSFVNQSFADDIRTGRACDISDGFGCIGTGNEVQYTEM